MNDILSLEQHKLAYSIDGEGPVLLLLHGFCEDKSMWKAFKAPLLSRYQVLCVDIPGFGASTLPENLSMESVAEDINSLLEHLKIEKCVLTGHSMGGYIALAFAEKYPERLCGLGLLHSHPFADDLKKQTHRTKAISFIERLGASYFIKELIPKLFGPSHVEKYSEKINELIVLASGYSDAAIMAALAAMRARPDRSAVLKELSLPVLFLCGEEDLSIPMELVRSMIYLPEIADIQILKSVGHMGMHTEKERCQQIIESFLNFSFNNFD